MDWNASLRGLHFVLLIGALFAVSPASAATWNVYLPPTPYSAAPPPFSAGTWIFVDTFDDDEGFDDCAGEALHLHSQYFQENQADSDRWKRALQVVCVNQQTGAVDQDNLKTSAPPSAPTPTTAAAPTAAEQDWRAMGSAVQKNDLKTVKALLARGVRPDAPHPDMEDQLSPLDEAACAGNIAMAAFLLKQGAGLEANENVGNYTPLMFAANCGRPAMIKFLLGRGANINAKSNKGWTPLDFAIAGKEAKHRQAARALLAHGAASGRNP